MHGKDNMHHIFPLLFALKVNQTAAREVILQKSKMNCWLRAFEM